MGSTCIRTAPRAQQRDRQNSGWEHSRTNNCMRREMHECSHSTRSEGSKRNKLSTPGIPTWPPLDFWGVRGRGGRAKMGREKREKKGGKRRKERREKQYHFGVHVESY